MDCLIDGVRIEDKCAARCINSTCTGFFLDVQGCCILRPVLFSYWNKETFFEFNKKIFSHDQNEPFESNFTETQFVGILTPQEIQGRLSERITVGFHNSRVQTVLGALCKMDIAKFLGFTNITPLI